jgi:hypothetical protein
MKLFSYCIPIDDGAAPNPFWGVCTLAICKPVIRRVAEEGDWIIGVGSKNVSVSDYSRRLVYAMKVKSRISYENYFKHCKAVLQEKIPDILDSRYERKVGDCIYDFDKDWRGHLLPSVHSEENKQTDLNGMNVLLSEHFFTSGMRLLNYHQSLKYSPGKVRGINQSKTSQ